MDKTNSKQFVEFHGIISEHNERLEKHFFIKSYKIKLQLPCDVKTTIEKLRTASMSVLFFLSPFRNLTSNCAHCTMHRLDNGHIN